MFLRNTGTAVLDFHDRLFLGLSDPHPNRTVFGRVLNRVVEQVDDRLPEKCPVSVDNDGRVAKKLNCLVLLLR
jgi:hypothetical protein